MASLTVESVPIAGMGCQPLVASRGECLMSPQDRPVGWLVSRVRLFTLHASFVKHSELWESSEARLFAIDTMCLRVSRRRHGRVNVTLRLFHTLGWVRLGWTTRVVPQ